MTFDENGKVRQSVKVIINDSTWDVDVVSPDNEALTINGRQCRGATWCGQQRIALSAMLDQRTAWRVITHEVTHAFMWATQVHVQEAYTEEEICDFVGCYGAQINRCVNEIFAALIGEDRNAEQ